MIKLEMENKRERLNKCKASDNTNVETGLQLINHDLKYAQEHGDEIDRLVRQDLQEVNRTVYKLMEGNLLYKGVRMSIKDCKAEIVRCYREMLATLVEKSGRRKELKEAAVNPESNAARCIRYLEGAICSLEYCRYRTCVQLIRGNLKKM